MLDLTPRQQTLLALVIREHVETAKPVSSKALVEKYALDYSPATIRHELAALEERGFLTHPHTAGNFRREFWTSDLMERMAWDAWQMQEIERP